METNTDVVLFAEGEIALWCDEDRAIHLKAISAYGDPVELTATEARELADALLKLAAIIE